MTGDFVLGVLGLCCVTGLGLISLPAIIDATKATYNWIRSIGGN